MLLRENDRTACTSAKVIQEYFATQGQELACPCAKSDRLGIMRSLFGFCETNFFNPK